MTDEVAEEDHHEPGDLLVGERPSRGPERLPEQVEHVVPQRHACARGEKRSGNQVKTTCWEPNVFCFLAS